MKRLNGPSMYHYFAQDVEFYFTDAEQVLDNVVVEYPRFHNFSILKMNDDFMEVIDQRYAWLGRGVGVIFFGLLISSIILIICFYLIIFSQANLNLIYCLLMLLLLSIFPGVFLYYSFKHDARSKICHPILFNRKNQNVYFYINNDEYIVKHWKDVVWVMSPSDGAGGAPIYEIQAHIVEDGIVKNTFLIGFPVIEKRKNYGLWNFICHFMEQGPEQLYAYKNAYYSAGELATKLPYCHRLVGAKESYRDTWQAMRNIYKHNLFFRIWTLFLDIFYFFGRRVLLNLLPLPVWPEQVRIENEFDKVRPEQVDYQDNRE